MVFVYGLIAVRISCCCNRKVHCPGNEGKKREKNGRKKSLELDMTHAANEQSCTIRSTIENGVISHYPLSGCEAKHRRDARQSIRSLHPASHGVLALYGSSCLRSRPHYPEPTLPNTDPRREIRKYRLRSPKISISDIGCLWLAGRAANVQTFNRLLFKFEDLYIAAAQVV